VRWSRKEIDPSVDLRFAPFALLERENPSSVDHSLPDRPAFPETPSNAIGPVVKEKIIVDGKILIIQRPEGSDHLLDDPRVRASFSADEYLPYWTDLWPAGRMLAKVILREPWPPGMKALELGCGLGLPGIAALSQGLRVTFADCDMTALRFAAENARANQFENFDLLRLDWRCPPDDLAFPVILASDLAYELRNLAPLAALIKKALMPGGICLLTDPDRPLAPRLREELTFEGLRFTTQVVRAGEPGGRRTKGTLYRIYHAP
jgi:predicted nicotinamide N-methyase